MSSPRRGAVTVSLTRALVGALLGVLAAVVLAMSLQAKPAEAASTCADSLQAKIDAAPSGGTVTANPCVYREQVTINKPLVLRGQPGSEIRGSDVWTSWSSDGGYWKSGKTLPGFPQEDVSCEVDTYRCMWPEQVFLDGKPLEQVASNPGSGQFAVNANRRVVLKDDPRKRRVEVTVRRHWITGATSADNVTVEGFTMKHAANEWRNGAIINRPTSSTPGKSRTLAGGDKWTVKNNVLSDAHGAILSIKNAPGHKILNNDISRGGQLGIHNAGSGELIQGNEIYDNNTENFCYKKTSSCTVKDADTGSISNGSGILEAGGIKIAGGIPNTIVDGNEVYSNRGNGIWYDVDATNGTISNNRIHHNARRGIHYEISDDGKIFGNAIWENGWGTPDWVEGAGIGIGNSSNVEVYDNTLAWNADGISVVGLDRAGTKWDLVHDVYVQDNTVLAANHALGDAKNLALGWLQGWSTQMFDPANNNRGENNKYWYTTPEGSAKRFEWKKTGYGKLADFSATPGEEGGRYLSQSEKDAVVAGEGIPADPEPR